MKSSGFLKSLAAVSLAATAIAASAQNAIKLFGPVNVRPSTQGTTDNNPNNFNALTLDLECPAPIRAMISSSPDGTGKVLVDNYIELGLGGAAPIYICNMLRPNEAPPISCYNAVYGNAAKNGHLTGANPDSLVATGGVGPLDISSLLTPGPVQAGFVLSDTGGALTNSTLYLVTNCTSNGVVGPGLKTGNPISSTNPTPAQLTQMFSFNSTPNQQVQFSYDLSHAWNSGSLSIPNGSTPSVADTPLLPAAFSDTYLHGTSFATATCLPHSGEMYNGFPACKLYTLTCQINSNPEQSGALCPTSQDRNEIFQEVFDGPSFTLPDITGKDGLTFHQGVGFIEASEGWNGGPCLFDPASTIAHLLCPQNVLTTFSGPGAYRSGGSGQAPNSSFITVAPVPEDLTAVTVKGQRPGYWVNTHTPTIKFLSTPPALTSDKDFVASPIESLTYGISSPLSVPQPPAPIAGDTTLSNVACPTPGESNPPAATPFRPPPQTTNNLPDGKYFLHYFAQDCAGTQELQFTQTGGNWSTSFYTHPLNVDTVAPVASLPTLSPAPSTNGGVPNSYLLGEKVTATYSCTDDLSGIVKCGTSTYSASSAPLDTGNITSPVDTSSPGPHTFTVKAVDAAGNKATPAAVNYTVVSASPVSLAILKTAPQRVKQYTQMIYNITAYSLSQQTASAIVITDPLPSGVTLVKATAHQWICGKSGCYNAASCTSAGNTVSCTAPAMTLVTPLFVEIKVGVSAPAETVIENTATVTSSNPVVPPGNTESSAFTVVY